MDFCKKECSIRVASYFDLHSHLLFGVDDGAKTKEEMFAMLDMAYADGTRAICLTPHFSPYLFGDTYESSQAVFEVLREYAEKTYPDLKLFLGHELGYYDGCIEAADAELWRVAAMCWWIFPRTWSFFRSSAPCGVCAARDTARFWRTPSVTVALPRI